MGIDNEEDWVDNEEKSESGDMETEDKVNKKAPKKHK